MKDFKDFAMKGNVLDLAVAVIIGGAFQKIISSLVDNVIMPIIGAIIGDANYFSTVTVGGIKVGLFIQAIVDFLIIAFILFLMVRALQGKKKAAPPPAPSSTDQLLMEIRDELRKK